MIRFVICLATAALCHTSFGQVEQETRQAAELESGGVNFQLMPEMPKEVSIQSNHGAEYDHEAGLVYYRRGVQIDADNGMQLFANRATLDLDKQEVVLEGDVSIYQGSLLHRGKRATYNYKTKSVDTKGLRSSIGPILLDSDSFEAVEENGELIFKGKDAGVTTHDRQHPNYWIRANEISVYPDDKVVFHDLKLKAGDATLLWLPYLAQPLDERLGYHFVPGSRSNWGIFLLNSYGVMLSGDEGSFLGGSGDEWLLADMQFDIRSKRGLAGGVDFYDTRLSDNSNLGWLKLYYAKDQDPELSRSGVPREHVSSDRFKVELKHRKVWQQSAAADLLFDVNLTFLSDRHYLEDFESGTYNTYSQPDNVVGIQSRTDHYQLGALTRFQLNDFYTSDTRFPEVYFDQVKRPVFGSGFLHESVSSLGMYREELGSSEARAFREELLTPGISRLREGELTRLLADNKFVRLHAYHELSHPLHIVDGFALTPRVGAGYSHYWEEGASNADHGSMHFYAGLDAALKFSKKYSNVQSSKWGLNELLHVVQPYANLSVLSTDELDAGDSKIDRLTPTERPRVFDVARYNAIDDFRNWSIVRLGVRNQLLTKRDGSSHSWLTMNTFVDTFLNDPEFDRQYSNLYNSLDWRPVPWGRFRLQTQFPISSEGFTELTSSVNFLPSEDVEVEFGYSYLNDHPVIRDSNQVHGRLNWRISDRWGIGAYQRWQFEDGNLDRQEYSVNRNFESWSLGIGAFQRDNRLKNEYGILFNISLNAVPQASLPFDFGAN